VTHVGSDRLYLLSGPELFKGEGIGSRMAY
jgi:hypothetical protein